MQRIDLKIFESSRFHVFDKFLCKEKQLSNHLWYHCTVTSEVVRVETETVPKLFYSNSVKLRKKWFTLIPRSRKFVNPNFYTKRDLLKQRFLRQMLLNFDFIKKFNLT